MQSAACRKYAKMFMVLLCACTFFLSSLASSFFSRSFLLFKGVEGALFLSSEPEDENVLQRNAKRKKNGNGKLNLMEKTSSIDKRMPRGDDE